MTHLGIAVSDEGDELVVLYLETFIENLRDEEAAVGLPVDDTAAVELLVKIIINNLLPPTSNITWNILR